ncbi:MAG: hypothetical protein K8I29_11895 [Alphaproteobacteria bacterium]|uniref:Uncharacterized protein n=1 Tax=Candidatus Nitrobium versatile TaxID=2884831 RepID=A0A953JE52_9BACT|nr:hypothetical protein [Candidatus Nitrobium versatile]
MVHAEEYDALLKDIGREYFVPTIRYVPDLAAWARQNRVDLHEPRQPMKLVVDEEEGLVMVVQAEVAEDILDAIITGLDVRWQVVDNAEDLSLRFDTMERRLAYCFLKEYARTRESLAEDERLEDEWALRQMERLGLFDRVRMAERDMQGRRG